MLPQGVIECFNQANQSLSDYKQNIVPPDEPQFDRADHLRSAQAWLEQAGLPEWLVQCYLQLVQ